MLYCVGILGRRYQAAMFHLHGTLSNPPRFRILKSGSILRLRIGVVCYSPVVITPRLFPDVKFAMERRRRFFLLRRGNRMDKDQECRKLLEGEFARVIA